MRATTVVEPRAQIVHLAVRRSAQPEPGFLDGVLGLAQGAKHAIGDRPQTGPLRLEPLCQLLALVHRSHSSIVPGHTGKTRDRGLM